MACQCQFRTCCACFLAPVHTSWPVMVTPRLWAQVLALEQHGTPHRPVLVSCTSIVQS